MSTPRIEASDLEEHQALSLMMVDGEPALWIWRSADWLEARDSTSPARWVSPSRARRPSRRSSASATRPSSTRTTFWRADPPRESPQEAPRRPQEPREGRGGAGGARGPSEPWRAPIASADGLSQGAIRNRGRSGRSRTSSGPASGQLSGICRLGAEVPTDCDWGGGHGEYAPVCFGRHNGSRTERHGDC